MRIGLLATSFLLITSSLFGQYKMETAGAPPSDIPAAIAGVLAKDGVKITNNGQPYAELWFRSTAPVSSSANEDSVTWTGVAHGALIGVVRFPAKLTDRRGSNIPAGTYTLRLSFFPVNGDHQGVAPQRDFLLVSKIAEDQNPTATPKFDDLVEASRKVTGTPHPGVFSMWKVENDFKPGFDKMGETDWVLQVKIAGTPVAIILVGKTEA
ncbi:MAG: hypothetical protein HY820_32365 [Acidobacteria bacterium]|nr:hypothetical protein [Acidobacteriota bacterium]